MDATMESFVGLQSRLHSIAARKKVAQVKLKSSAVGAAPKGPYLNEDGTFPTDDEGDTGYGPRGTTRCATDTPVETDSPELAGTPFGVLPTCN